MSTDVEQLLKRIPLHKPSASLDDRVLDTLARAEMTADHRADALSFDDGPQTYGGSRALPWVMFALATAACAALAAVMWFGPGTPAERTTPGPTVAGPSDDSSRDKNTTVTNVADFNPVRIEQVWTGVQPEGVVFIDDTPVRRYRQQTIEHVQLVDEEKNIRIEITVPREDVIVTPVDYD